MTNPSSNLDNKINTTAKKTFSTVGFAFCAITLGALGAQFIAILISNLIAGEKNWLTTSYMGNLLLSFVPIYLVAYPLGLLILKRIPSVKPNNHKLKATDIIIYLAISFALMYFGNYVGQFLSALLSNNTAENALNELVFEMNPIMIIVSVVLAPIAEEYIFRKQLIDKIHVFGEKRAVLLSGLIFGLIHTNMFQFFYAFLLGTLFAYIYIRTGRIKYTMILHSIVNFMGSVVAPFILSLLDVEKMETLANMDPATVQTEEFMKLYSSVLPGMTLSLVYSAIMLGLSIWGSIMLFRRMKRTVWLRSVLELPEESAASTVYMNYGIVAYIAISATLTIVSLFL